MQDLKKKIMADVEAKKKDGALLNYCMKYKVNLITKQLTTNTHHMLRPN